VKRLLAAIRAFFARLFGREPTPGRFESGSGGALQGWIASAPLVLPRRDYLVYVPRGHGRWSRAPVVVLCHGCRQTPEELASATRIADAADEHGWLVLLPRQKDDANAWRCWNWFDARTARGAGETAIVLAQLAEVQREHHGDGERVIVAGLSAGGALAAVIGVHHGDRVRGVFVHSGLACGAASGPHAAMRVMQQGPDTDVVAIAAEARRGQARPRSVALCVVHGDADDVVAPRNAAALVRQYLALNGHPALARGEGARTDPGALPTPDRESRDVEDSGRIVTTREWTDAGRLIVRYVSIDGLRHAWSGGDAAYPYNDALPPPATGILARFAADIGG
jgi:poly(3-hydroxybutyrate) depolymerase